jgi:DNA-binding beta-propeller fold protein YncE
MRILEQKRLVRATFLALLAAGCATQNKTGKPSYSFYPPPPDPPRLQFLTAFSSEKEFRGGEEQSLMTFLTGAKPAEKSFGKPYGGAANDKKFFVCDTEMSAVLALDLQTRHFAALDTQGEGALKLPLNITFDAEGNSYIVDAGREQVVILDKNKSYVAAIGKAREMKPRDVAVNRDRIYVADLMKHNVHVFDKASRNLLFDIPSPADSTNRTRGLFTPTNLALDSKSRLYVSDSGAFRVQVYDAEGKYVRSIGELGDHLGQFARVKGVAVDRNDRLYAVDAMSQVTQIFDADGHLLTWFGEPETGIKIQNLPAKVFLDYEDVSFFQRYAAPGFQVEHLVVIINQLGPHKVSVYGFGHKK